MASFLLADVQLGALVMGSGTLRDSAKLLATGFVFALGFSSPLWAACSFGGAVSVWTHGSDGNWNSAGNWSGGSPNAPTTSACITDGTSSVALNQDAAIKNLQLGFGNGLDITGGHRLTLWGDKLLNAGHVEISAASSDARIWISHDVTLSGGGTVTMGTTGAGVARMQSVNGNFTLTNSDNTIEGAGVIAVHLANAWQGVLDANVAGQVLVLGGTGSSNAGLFEASNNGILQIATTIANTGVIEADGGTVRIAGGTIDGGTLKSINGGVLKTASGKAATLKDVTIAAGSTYRSGANTITHLSGNITNNGVLAVSSVGGTANTLLDIQHDVTLTGGGILQMNLGNGLKTVIRSLTNTTFTNVDNTIRGAGTISGATMNFVNDSAGVVYANAAGKTLAITPGGQITNFGTFKAGSGATLLVGAGVFTNYQNHTLTGGTYDALGTIQINQLGTAGGEIVNNDADIILDGLGSKFVDKAGLDALSKLANNLSEGSFTIANGRSFTSANTFSNAGQVTIGQGSTFQANTAYNQLSGGTTRIDGTLKAQAVTNNAGGTLEGTGNIVGDLFNYGTVKPGDSPGKLTIDGNFLQGAGGTLTIEIAGLGAGQYDQIDVSGLASLAGKLALNLLNGFTLAAGDTFDILKATGISGDFSALSLNGNGCSSGPDHSWYCGGLDGLYFVELFLDGIYRFQVVDGPAPVPEPESLPLLMTGIVVIMCLRRRRRRASPTT